MGQGRAPLLPALCRRGLLTHLDVAPGPWALLSLHRSGCREKKGYSGVTTYGSEAFAPLSYEADCLGAGGEEEDLDREGRWASRGRWQGSARAVSVGAEGRMLAQTHPRPCSLLATPRMPRPSPGEGAPVARCSPSLRCIPCPPRMPSPSRARSRTCLQGRGHRSRTLYAGERVRPQRRRPPRPLPPALQAALACGAQAQGGRPGSGWQRGEALARLCMQERHGRARCRASYSWQLASRLHAPTTAGSRWPGLRAQAELPPTTHALHSVVPMADRCC